MLKSVMNHLQFGSAATSPTKPTKVAIIGAGNVGCSAATALVYTNACDEIALQDLNDDATKGRALDMTQAAAAFGGKTKVTGSNKFDVIDNADIVVVTAGSKRKPGETRSDMIKAAAGIIGSICQQIKLHAPNAKILMVSNPSDVMTYTAQKLTGFSPNRVFGLSGLLDAGRMAESIATLKNVPLQAVKTLVMGEHGDTMIPMFSQSTVNGQPVEPMLTPAEKAEVTEATIKGGSRLITLMTSINSASSFGPGAAIARMVRAVLNDTKEVLPCSAQLNGEFGQTGIYAGVPAVLGANGVEQVKDFPLTPDEQTAWTKTTDAIKANIATVDALLAPPAPIPAVATP